MSILSIFYNILIMPLQLFFEILFMLANRVVNNPGLSIIVLSLAMNFLVLPLYRRADAMQEEERDIEAKLHDGVKHIKKTFKGDERMMILNTYYRQNGYKPTYVFRGAISLFLEIPFFIAAYQFLSHLELLQGVAFGPLKDLGAADALLTIGGIHINLLPIIMTAVNLVSCVIFTKGYPTKTKVQLYSMAIFFFFFLYSSPSGLVFYWTLNNLFSLVKTIFYKLKHAKQILLTMFAIAGAGLVIIGCRFLDANHVIRAVGVVGLGVACIIPSIIYILQMKHVLKEKQMVHEANAKIFIAAALYLVVLIGVVIPSSVIKASPQEFVDVYYYYHPLWYVAYSLCLAAGTFLVWCGVFYWLADKRSKGYFEIASVIIAGLATANYMMFGKNLGIMNNLLQFDNEMAFSGIQLIKNLLVILLIIIGLVGLYRFIQKYLAQFLMVCAFALAGVSLFNVSGIDKSIKQMMPMVEQAKLDTPEFTLSKNGKNVIVMMIDRGIGEFVPYFINEKPELKEMYKGFTYYANTVSFGPSTNMATPALYGGYEYTPYEINKRDTESLVSKQNEALKVMPVLFEENGYDVTVCDPTYANYQAASDTSIYDDYPDIHTYITNGRFADKQGKEAVISSNKRNFFCYSVMKTLPLFIQPTIYDNGNYNHQVSIRSIDGQTIVNNYISDGFYSGFMNAYTVLENLPSMTKITDDSTNSFLMMANDTAHEATLVQEPEYEPAEHIDNTAYETEHPDRYDADGNVLQLRTGIHYVHYQSNMAALLKIGEWLDYLKQEGVYDNTRIIIVADHGRAMDLDKKMIMDDGSNALLDLESYYPLFMVKDFNSEDFTISEDFMTNADVPTLATNQIIDNPQNPFTGNAITNDNKYNQELYILGSDQWNIDTNNGNWFVPGMWLTVHDDIRKKENWSIVQQNTVYPIVP